jgi:hypothetical protein
MVTITLKAVMMINTATRAKRITKIPLPSGACQSVRTTENQQQKRKTPP